MISQAVASYISDDESIKKDVHVVHVHNNVHYVVMVRLE